MNAEDIVRIAACIFPALTALVFFSEHKKAFGKLEDIAGCNGEVCVSVNEDGQVVLQGPCGESLTVDNWHFDNRNGGQ